MAEETPAVSDREERVEGEEEAAEAVWTGPKPVEEPPEDPTKLSQEFRKLFCDGSKKGEFLFQDYWEYFGNWSPFHFSRMRKSERIMLRDALRANGVYVQRDRAPASIALAQTARAKDNIWPEDQLRLQIQNAPETVPDQIRSTRQATTSTTQTLYQRVPPPHQRNKPTVVIDSVESTPPEEEEGTRQRVQLRSNFPRAEVSQSSDNFATPAQAKLTIPDDDLYGATPPVHTKREFTFTPGRGPLNTAPIWRPNENLLPNPVPAPDVYPRDGSLPPFAGPRPNGPYTEQIRPSWYVQDTLTQGQSKSLVSLSKMYTKELQYSGSKDHLDEKLHIFADFCQKAGVNYDIWHRAFPTMLRDGASSYYYRYLQNKGYKFDDLIKATRTNFETEERANQFLSRWFSLTFSSFQAEPYQKGRPILAQLESFARELQSIQLGLKDDNMRNDKTLRDKLVQGVSGNPLFKMALFRAPPTFPTLMDSLRTALSVETTHESGSRVGKYTGSGPNHYRSYVADGRALYSDRRMKFSAGNKRGTKFQPKPGYTGCIICKKMDCHSSCHSDEEQRASKAKYFAERKAEGMKATNDSFKAYLAYTEGTGLDSDQNRGGPEIQEDNPDSQDSDTSLYSDDLLTGSDGGNKDGKAFFTTVFTASEAEYDVRDVMKRLDERKASHVLESRIQKPPQEERYTTQWTDRFFQGLLIDTGASGKNVGGINQLRALQRVRNVKYDTSQSGRSRIQFGAGSCTSLGVATVDTPVGVLDFHIVDTDVPFLVCLQQLDKMGAYYDNLQNVLVQGDKRYLIVRKKEHPWLLLDQHHQLIEPSVNIISQCHLTEAEIRRLHRRFGHPSVQRLQHLLDQAGHESDSNIMLRVKEMCEHCQKHADAPHRFRFKLQDDVDFNHTVYVDIAQFGERYALHMVDEATGFGAAKLLRKRPGSATARATFNAFKSAWMDTYIGPPDFVVYDYGTNFNSAEFRSALRAVGSTPKLVPVEAHHSIGKVERYHRPLRRAYEIVTEEHPDMSDEDRLQMAVKAVNDTAGPNGLIPTLLVFGAYPKMTEMDPPNPSIQQRAETIKRAMIEVRQIHAKRQVNDALATRNGPGTTHIHDLKLQDQVLVWREKKGWKGPYTFLGMEDEACKINMDNGRTRTFRSTSVRPFKTDTSGVEQKKEKLPDVTREPSSPVRKAPETAPKAPRIAIEVPFTKPIPGLPTIDDDYDAEVFLTEKETRDRELSIKLRAEGKITTPGPPFQQSRRTEYEALIKRGVFMPISKGDPRVRSHRIFKSRMVDEVKGKESATPYEKSRLVIQCFNDKGKKEILTQSPTIQRVSQRLLISLAATMRHPNQVRKGSGMRLAIRDITQAYVQSTTKLLRNIFAWPPEEIADEFPPGTIFMVMLPLYGIPESGNHWFNTYHKHHMERLQMETSTYDPCLLISTKESHEFGVVGMQTDDTLILGDDDFLAREQDGITEANFLTKPIQVLLPSESITFNGCTITLDEDDIYISQKGQGARLELVDVKAPDYKKAYVEQRARGAYIATICQPEANFDLSVAAQHQDPTIDDAKALNQRLQWQMDNAERGLRYIPVDLHHAKLYVFVDGSFANNKDLSSQIGFLVVIGTETEGDTEFILSGNIIHASSTKCKRVTRAVLASELYAMVAGIDMLIALGTTVNMVTDKLGLPRLPTVVCTDSLSLYECIVKLGTTKEKRLMIDIMAIRQSYERRELTEIRWIDGTRNPADAMTKTTPNRALQELIDTNTLTVKMEGWVQRPLDVDLEANLTHDLGSRIDGANSVE